MFTTPQILITPTTCFLKLFNNPADNVSMVQHEWKTINDIVSPQQDKNPHKSKIFDR
jgi:hypothetical protein